MIGLDEIRKKGVEHLQKYETVIGELLRYDVFTKADIYRCGVSKIFVGRLIHRLVEEGTFQELSKGQYGWASPEAKAQYRTEWLDHLEGRHQLKRLPESERPREILLFQGPEKLTTAQKLAIFLRTGVKGKSAVQLASELLERFGSLRGIFLSMTTKTAFRTDT